MYKAFMPTLTTTDRIAAVHAAIEASRRALARQVAEDAKECAGCGETVGSGPCRSSACVARERTCRECDGDVDDVGELSGARRCEQCQEQVDHDRWVDDRLDEMRDEGGGW